MEIRAVEADQLNAELEKKSSILLDIREEYEYEDDHLESIHIPMAEVKSRLKDLEQHENIIICCKSGNRARAIAYMLNKNLSNTNISYLSGGMEAYRQIYAQKQ